MDKELQDLLTWFETVSTYELPNYNELPRVPLYMEQVTGYINNILKPVNPTDNDPLTSFMVNNYVKADIMSAPNKKKYTEEHLGYLLAITTLKRTLSISEIALLIEMDGDVSSDKSVLYGFFRIMAKDILQEVSAKVLSKAKAYAERYEKEVAVGNPKAEMNLRDSLGLIALRMSIQAGVYQLLSQTILDYIGKEMHGKSTYEKEITPGHKEKRRENKITAAQTKRIVEAKKLSKDKKTNPVKQEKEKK